MSDQTTATAADLRRVMDELKAEIEADCDPKDNWPTGRWPMVHRLARRIDAMERNNA